MNFDKIMVIISHPDDELMCYSTLAKFLHNGSSVRVLLSTAVEPLRAHEFVESMTLLGLKEDDWRIMDDEEDCFLWTREAVQPYDEEFFGFGPDLVIGHRTTDSQQHHANLGNITHTLCRKNNTTFWEMEQAIPGGIEPSALAPNVFVDVSEFWGLKKACVEDVYLSQKIKYQNWMEGIEGRAKMWGWLSNINGERSINTPYIEAFRLIKGFWL